MTEHSQVTPEHCEDVAVHGQAAAERQGVAVHSQDVGRIPAPDTVLIGLRDAVVAVLDPDDLARIDVAAIDASTPLLSLPVDSLALMELMTRIEDRFRVYIPEERAYAFETVGQVIEYVREKAAAKAARKRD